MILRPTRTSLSAALALSVVALLFFAGTARAVQNGSNASGEAPWAARIAGLGYSTWCSGAVIADSWVLTAAHCVIDETRGFQLSPSLFTVWINGTSYLLRPQGIETLGSGLGVRDIKGTGGDVALLHLVGSMKANLAKPLPLAPTIDVAAGFVNRGVTFFGFGRTSPTGPSTSIVQKLHDGAFYETPYCQYGAATRCFLKTQPYGIDRSAVLPGDSGGPWVAWEGGSWVGIAVEHGGLNPDAKADLGLQAGAEVGAPSVRDWIVARVGEVMAPPRGTILRNRTTQAAWLVGNDGFRRWIPDGGTYQCLVAQNHVVEDRDQFDIETVPDRVGEWATASCSPTVQPPTAVGYRVADADGGVYWRSGPDWSKSIKVSGWGVYTGDRVGLQCWIRGGVVPPFNNNPLWYRATHISGRGTGSGYVNDHFLLTSTNLPNVPEPGIPPCVQDAPLPPPSTPSGLTVSAVTRTSFSVSWAAVATADDYVLYLDGARMLTFAGTTFTFQGMACGSSHVIGVQAESALGVSGTTTVTGTTAACAQPSTLAGMHVRITLNATPHTAPAGGTPICPNLGPDQLFAFGNAASGALAVQQLSPSTSGWSVSDNGLYAVVELTPDARVLQFAIVDIGVQSASGHATFTTALGPGCDGQPISPATPLPVTGGDAHQPSSLLTSSGCASYTRTGDTFTLDVTFGAAPCGTPHGDPPTVTGVSNNAGVTGGPAFLIRLDFTDADCDVVGGTWTDQFGTPHDFGYGNGGPFSSGCEGGVGFTTPGFASCTSPEGIPGQPGEYPQTIVLRDAGGNVSAPFVFPVICRAP
jgi:hypothetical protein